MIKPDRPPFCEGIGGFWKFWLGGGLIYLAERTMREIRGNHKTYISKVIEHPSNVVEIQIKKAHTNPRAGQVCFITNMPQWVALYAHIHHSIFSSVVQRSQSGNITHLRSPALPKRIIFPCIYAV